MTIMGPQPGQLRAGICIGNQILNGMIQSRHIGSCHSVAGRQECRTGASGALQVSTHRVDDGTPSMLILRLGGRVTNDDRMGQRVQVQGVVILPEDGLLYQRQGAQV
jgi:hypothetical protein